MLLLDQLNGNKLQLLTLNKPLVLTNLMLTIINYSSTIKLTSLNSNYCSAINMETQLPSIAATFLISTLQDHLSLSLQDSHLPQSLINTNIYLLMMLTSQLKTLLPVTITSKTELHNKDGLMMTWPTTLLILSKLLKKLKEPFLLTFMLKDLPKIHLFLTYLLTPTILLSPQLHYHAKLVLMLT